MTPLQGNLDFFLIRASRGPFRLRHKTQGPSHIPSVSPQGSVKQRVCVPCTCVCVVLSPPVRGMGWTEGQAG